MSVAIAAPQGCSRCASPLEEGDLRCSVCALPAAGHGVAVGQARTQILRCTECGAAVGFDANKQAPACAFCGAVMRVEQPVDPIEVATSRVPFGVGREQATTAMRAWLARRGFFAPRTLRDEAVIESMSPLYWAGWVVNAKALVTWTADSDADSRQSDWAPHAGEVHMEFDDIVVPATRGLRPSECATLVPHYDFRSTIAIEAAPASDASLPDEQAPPIESFDAQRSAARQQVAAAVEVVAKQRVEPHIPGRVFRNVHVSVLLEGQTTSRVGLPAWVLAYRYRGLPYRAIVHGQRAEIVVGTSPTDWSKVMLVVFTIVAAAIGLVLLLERV